MRIAACRRCFIRIIKVKEWFSDFEKKIGSSLKNISYCQFNFRMLRFSILFEDAIIKFLFLRSDLGKIIG